MTKIVLVGAGSLQFGTSMLGDIFSEPVLNGAEIVLNDINGEAALKTLKIAQDYIDAEGLDHNVSAEMEFTTAVKDADFVIISIEVGDRFALWDQDWKIPQQYGIPQIYGENGGPGGLFHSLRIIPPILEIVGKTMEHAPGATIFNFSNPMSRICTTVHKAYPEAKFVGLCHEIASLERHLAPLLGMERKNFHYRAGGLNHFSVVSSVTATDGTDLTKTVLDKAPAYFSKVSGYSDILKYTKTTGIQVDTEGWMELETKELDAERPWSDRWLFKEILEHFGVLPITYDSHFGEYIHWAHHVSDHRGILDFYTLYRNFLGQTEPTIDRELHERAVPIMKAMLTNERYEEAAVNIPNNGLIANLPDWICVEVPAFIDSKGIEGIPVTLPHGMRGLLSNQVGIHDMTALAVLEKRKELVIQALLVDPINPVLKGIPELVDHMIEAQSPWLDYLE
jgi:alpha-galactosidase